MWGCMCVGGCPGEVGKRDIFFCCGNLFHVFNQYVCLLLLI